jgi:hypothetical protein
MFAKQMVRALTLAVIGSLLMSTAVFADDIYNNLDTTIDATAETASVEVGATRSVTLMVDPTGGDGKNGCNFQNQQTLVTSVSSSNTSVATVSPSSITWGSCGQATNVTVTANAIGSATISLAQVSNTTSGSFNLAPATFTVNVTQAAPTDTTGPTITPSITGTEGNGGWYTSNVTLSWAVSDAESAVSSSMGCGTTNITSDQGVTTYTCTATSAGGTTSQAVSIKRDATAPSATLSVFAGDSGSNGWYTSNVTVRTSGTDGGSGIASCTADQIQTTETSGTTFNGSCTDNAGNVTGAAPLTVKLDKTAPTAALSVTAGTPGDDGWYTSNVTIHTSGTDGGSGIDSCTADQTQDTDTGGTIFNGSCTDNAGLETLAEALTIKLDKTAPTASLSVTGTEGSNGWYTSNVIVATSGTDATSGATCTADQTQTTETTGETFNGSCRNGAGLTTNATSLTVKLDKSAPVITPVITGTAGTSPWYTSNVDVDWTVEDGISGVPASDDACSVTTSITADSATATSVTCGATNGAGLSDSKTVSIKKDGSAPIISNTVTGTLGNGGWYIDDVMVDWAAPSDPHSGIASADCNDATFTTDTAAATSDCDATNGAGLESSDSVSVKRDATKPTISGAVAPAAPTGDAGWYKTAPTVTFTCGDATSGIASCLVDDGATNSFTLGESSTAQAVSGTATDNAGHIETASVSGLKVDLSNPTNIAFAGGPATGSSHYFGSVPAAPTCTADDAISGFKSCVVSGYGTTVGTHTLTATATDNAGRTATATRTYTVSAWTLKGFYSPVDMNGTLNTVKGGSTVPLKFEVFAGSTELTSTDAIDSFAVTKITCDSGATVDEIELTTTGGTSLRYDTTGGQFIQNWKTPTGSACYRVTMKTDDGSTLVAFFRTR